MVRRRIPRPSELAPLLRPAPFTLDRTAARLARASSIGDLRELARRRAPRAVFDYTDGAAEDEVSLRRAREVWASVEFSPTVLTDVSRVDTGREILGGRSSLPFALAPTGFTRMMHTEGERAVAAVAARAGIPYALSTMGSTTIEGVAEAGRGGRHWFQLYLWRDRSVAHELVSRAQEAGYDTLLLTVDTPVGGNRRRDARNGLSIPPALSLRTFVDGARHPRWWFDLLTTEPLTFESLAAGGGSPYEVINRVFDPALTLDDVTWLRGAWPGKLVVKGVTSVPDALRLRDAGLVVDQMVSCSPATMSGYYTDLMRHERTAGLKAFDGVPTTVMVGSADVLTPPSHARRLASAIEGARMFVLPGAGHYLPLERDEAVSAELVAAVERARP